VFASCAVQEIRVVSVFEIDTLKEEFLRSTEVVTAWPGV